MDETSAVTPPDPSRRRVLGLVAAAGVGGVVLAACGGSGTASTSGGGSASGSGSGGSRDLVPTAEVPVGGGVVLDAQKVVVTQPAAGTFKAFSAVCTHQGCTVGGVENGLIICPCHGSAYSAADGSVKNGPSTTPLPEVQVTVQGGNVVES